MFSVLIRSLRAKRGDASEDQKEDPAHRILIKRAWVSSPHSPAYTVLPLPTQLTTSSLHIRTQYIVLTQFWIEYLEWTQEEIVELHKEMSIQGNASL